MPLTPETQTRINTQSMTYWGKQKAGPCAKQRYEAYKEGSIDEAKRCQKLVEGLEQVVRCCDAAGYPMDRVVQDIKNEAMKYLNEYHQP